MRGRRGNPTLYSTELIDFSENGPHETGAMEGPPARVIAAVPEDLPPFESPHHHVVEDPWRAQARSPRHAATLQRGPTGVKEKG